VKGLSWQGVAPFSLTGVDRRDTGFAVQQQIGQATRGLTMEELLVDREEWACARGPRRPGGEILPCMMLGRYHDRALRPRPAVTRGRTAA
jgi:hypothetical protein